MQFRWFRTWPVIGILFLCLLALVVPLYAKSIPSGGDGVTYSLSSDQITLSWGQKPTGGYSIRINSLQRSGNTLTVYYSLQSPQPGEMVTTAITYPLASARLPAGQTAITRVELVKQPWSSLPAASLPATGLPSVGSADNLRQLLQEAGAEDGYICEKAMSRTSLATGAEPVPASSSQENSKGDYSQTNTQVAGVDEADLVKTDGQYIYQVNGSQVLIIKAYPPSKMQRLATLDCGDGWRPDEMYVDGNYMVVVATGYDVQPLVVEKGADKVKIRPPYPRADQVTRVVVYNIADRSHPTRVREVEIGGNYLSSRKIGSAVYLVTNQHVYLPDDDSQPPVPRYRDSAAGPGTYQVDYQDIHYFPECLQPNYLIAAGFNIDSREKVSVSSYLGAGSDIYVSPSNLYVAARNYRYYPLVKGELRGGIAAPRTDSDKTQIYRFALNSGKISYNGKGEVPGSILNQFSMDEAAGYFRVATTSGDSVSSNNLYVLDSNLSIAGRVENIAPGEKIYSARFLGDRAYLVTFRTVDPFYVIDLKSPQNPRILGALKIPGYSDYLHPYDANHVIGFGKDTIELANKDADGQVTGTSAYYTGMKMALFDVTDVAHPRQQFVEKIGDRGTDSELLHNHKALLFSREKNLLAFPVTVAEVQGSPVRDNFPQYGTFSWQGAYVYTLDLKKGFDLKARITHLSGEDYLKAGDYSFDTNKEVQRVLYIDDVLYTLSPSLIKATGLRDFKDISTLNL